MDKIAFTGSKYSSFFDFWSKSRDAFQSDFRFLQKKESLSLVGKEEKKILRIVLDNSETGKILSITKESNPGIFVLIISIFSILLKKYSGQKKLIIDTPLYRTDELDQVFQERVPLLIPVSEELSLKDHLGMIQQIVKESYLYQNYPFVLVSSGMDNIYQSNVLVKFDQIHADSLSMENYDFVVEIERVGGRIVLNLRYNQSFDIYFVNNIEKHFKQTLYSYSNLNILIREVEILDTNEKNLLLNGFNKFESYIPEQLTITKLFEEQVRKNPDAVAVIHGEISLTYGELNNMANFLAHKLKNDHRLQPESLVGLLVEKSEYLIISILGVLKAGCAYLPIDRSYPIERIEYLLSDSKVGMLITDSSWIYNLSFYSGELFAIDLQLNTDGKTLPNLPVEIRPDNLMYVCYTSGTTGFPNGVMIEHRGVGNLISDQIERLEITPEDKILQFTSLSFDVSMMEIFSALLAGATLVMTRQEMVNDPVAIAAYLKSMGVTIIILPASYFDVLNIDEVESLRIVMTGGETPNIEKVNHSKQFIKYFNAYGPTECTVNATVFEVEKEGVTLSVPIGLPIRNVKVYILDEDLKPLPCGIEGQIYVAGMGIARGYLHREAFTREKFINNPYKTEGYERLYKTGDLGIRLPDGNIEFRGRIDDQVKIRGFRVELEEIEAAIKRHPAIGSACVFVTQPLALDKSLTVAITVKNPSSEILKKLITLRDEKPQIFDKLVEMPNGMFLVPFRQDISLSNYKEIFEEKVIERQGVIINQGDVVFDAVPQDGIFPLYMTTLYENVTVYAFEPIKPIYENVLTVNLSLYNKNIIPLNVGLSQSEQVKEFSYYPNALTLSGSYKNEDEEYKRISFMKRKYPEAHTDLDEKFRKEKVTGKVRRISDVMLENKINTIHLLIVDSNNWDAIEGIDQDDWTRIKQIVVKCSSESDYSEIKNRMTDLGYRVSVSEISNFLYAIRNDYHVASKGPVVEPGESQQVFHLNPKQLIEAIRQLCQKSLPDHMVPAEIKLVEKIPLTINNKKDYKALKNLKGISFTSDEEIEGPRNEVEKTLFDLWVKVLEKSQIDVHSNFFDMGGNSIKVVKLLELINGVYPDKVKVGDLFDKPSIAEQAKWILPDEEPIASEEIEVLTL